jgi:uncharacterized membrane protein
MSTDSSAAPSKQPRLILIDAFRGVAILAMAAYHFGWDLFYLGWITTDITEDPVWVTAQRLILGSFVLLAGMSLALAHGNGIRWPGLWRRVAILAVAAIAVSIGTYIAFGEYFSFFGVLHALALFAILAIPFIRAPLWLILAAAAAIILGALLLSHPVFENRWLAWIGFWPVMPMTVDLVPVFPWFGILLIGVAGMRMILASPLGGRLAAIRGGRPLGALAWIGRWSLIIYLLHQPLIYGAVYGVTNLVRPDPPQLSLADDFTRTCRAQCSAAAPQAYCERYCGCALEEIEKADLWDAIANPASTAAQQSAVAGVIRLCEAMSETPLTAP